MIFMKEGFFSPPVYVPRRHIPITAEVIKFDEFFFHSAMTSLTKSLSLIEVK